MGRKISVIIADDHELFRKGLESVLKAVEGIGKIRQAVNGKEVLSLLKKEISQLIFMDINMPEMDGINATLQVKKNYPEVKVLTISILDDKPNISRMIQAGADGYLLKSTDKDELNLAIATVMKGKRFFTQYVAEILIEKPFRDYTRQQPALLKTKLNDREIEILKLICGQYSNKEIGEMLNLSGRTIEGHRLRLLEKTDSKNTAGLVLFAIQNKIIIPQ